MRAGSMVLLCIVFGVQLRGQYTYFNNIHGSEGETSPESVRNVVVSGDEYITFGGGGDADGLLHYFFHRYSSDGEFLDEVPYYFGADFVWTGVTNSFQKIPESDDYLYAQAIIDAEGTHGFLMRIGPDLDTLWTKKIDIFPPYTYFTTFAWDTDGFILAGEYGTGPGQRGTFIAKVDLDGEYLWHQILHEPSEGSFRNGYMSVLDSGYLLTGASGSGAETEGYVEFTDENGQLQWNIEGEGDAIRKGIVAHHVAENGDIIIAQSIAYEDWPFSSDPINAYFKMRLSTLDLPTSTMIGTTDYFDDHEWERAGAIKIIDGSNGGYVMAGPSLIPEGNETRSRSFIMKVNIDFGLEWYKELAHNPCPNCVNILYDLEQAPDGGYIMAGSFRDSDNDPYDNTWLVKVDACGDVEWQGCEPIEPDGLWEVGASASLSHLSLYPNPASDVVRVAVPPFRGSGGVRGATLSMIDIKGKLVQGISNVQHSISNDEVELDVSGLPTGLYTLMLTTEEGEVYSGKFIKE